MKAYLFLITVLLLSGCASQIPNNIRLAPTPDLAISDVIVNSNTPQKPLVRWGGSILKVTNRAKDTEIEILAKKLDNRGRPLENDHTLGRFLARVHGFLDPAVYTRNRMLTVYGPKNLLQTRKIGETPYTYPVIQAKTLYLWPSGLEEAFPYDCTDDLGAFGYYYNFGYYPYGGQYCMGHSW